MHFRSKENINRGIYTWILIEKMNRASIEVTNFLIFILIVVFLLYIDQ